jgi:hypothetical protein
VNCIPYYSASAYVAVPSLSHAEVENTCCAIAYVHFLPELNSQGGLSLATLIQFLYALFVLFTCGHPVAVRSCCGQCISSTSLYLRHTLSCPLPHTIAQRLSRICGHSTPSLLCLVLICHSRTQPSSSVVSVATTRRHPPSYLHHRPWPHQPRETVSVAATHPDCFVVSLSSHMP